MLSILRIRIVLTSTERLDCFLRGIEKSSKGMEIFRKSK